jgi:hypothetical protein
MQRIPLPATALGTGIYFLRCHEAAQQQVVRVVVP